jgi:F420-dependent oxidoreductase-like protein
VRSRTITFGIKTEQSRASAAELLEIWREIDELPTFRDAWLFDHFVPLRLVADGPCLEAWTLLSVLAVHTRRVRLGILVLGNTYRHPAVLANMAATLDILAEGRLELGLGAGWHAGEHAMYGIALPSVGDRIRAMDEACTVLRHLWTLPRSTFAGRFYQLENARCEPKPVQAGGPPISIGGTGERLTLRAAARHAARWNFNGKSVDEFVRLNRVLDEHCAAVGRDPMAIERSVQVHVTEDLDTAREEISRYVQAGADHVILNPRIPLRPGLPDALASTVAGL